MKDKLSFTKESKKMKSFGFMKKDTSSTLSAKDFLQKVMARSTKENNPLQREPHVYLSTPNEYTKMNGLIGVTVESYDNVPWIVAMNIQDIAALAEGNKIMLDNAEVSGNNLVIMPTRAVSTNEIPLTSDYQAPTKEITDKALQSFKKDFDADADLCYASKCPAPFYHNYKVLTSDDISKFQQIHQAAAAADYSYGTQNDKDDGPEITE